MRQPVARVHLRLVLIRHNRNNLAGLLADRLVGGREGPGKYPSGAVDGLDAAAVVDAETSQRLKRTHLLHHRLQPQETACPTPQCLALCY